MRICVRTACLRRSDVAESIKDGIRSTDQKFRAEAATRQLTSGTTVRRSRLEALLVELALAPRAPSKLDRREAIPSSPVAGGSRHCSVG